MKEIPSYFESGIDNVLIKHGRDTFSFSLLEELKIDENEIDGELKDQPSYFAFISILHVKLQKKRREIDFDLKTIKSRVWKEFKNKVNRQTGKPYSNDYVETQVHEDRKFKELSNKLIKVLHDLEMIEVCVEAFKQRSFVLLNLNNNKKID